MRIIRYQSADGSIGYAQQHADGTATRLAGSVAAGFRATTEPAAVAKLLAPVEPRTLLCIGLNYRQHAAESNAPLPQFPVLFAKNPAAVQNPGDPIVLPRWLRSDRVDIVLPD